MSKVNLTQKQVDSMVCPEGKTKIEVSDANQLGFYAEVRANTDNKTYYQRVNTLSGRRVIKVGTSAELTLKEAKALAAELKMDCLSGKLDRQISEQKASVSFNTFFEQTYLPSKAKKLREKTLYADRSLMKNHVYQGIGKLPINAIKSADLMSLSDALLAKDLKPSTINKVIASVKKVIRHAITLEILQDSSTLKVKQLTESNTCERFLSDEEAKRLIAVFQGWHVPQVALLLMFTLFTGARIGEVMKADWEHIDLENKNWYIPVDNDKVKKGRIVPLNDTALSILHSALALRKERQLEVFHSIQAKGRYKNVTLAWYKIREQAGLNDVRVHDLRHSFASYLVRNKIPLVEVSKLLGHNSIKTTMRYAHLDQDTIRQSSQTMDALFQLKAA